MTHAPQSVVVKFYRVFADRPDENVEQIIANYNQMIEFDPENDTVARLPEYSRVGSC